MDIAKEEIEFDAEKGWYRMNLALTDNTSYRFACTTLPELHRRKTALLASKALNRPFSRPTQGE